MFTTVICQLSKSSLRHYQQEQITKKRTTVFDKRLMNTILSSDYNYKIHVTMSYVFVNHSPAKKLYTVIHT